MNLKLATLALLLVLPLTAFAQTKRKKPVKKPAAKPAAVKTEPVSATTASPSTAEPLPSKANERPADPSPTPQSNEPKKANRPDDKGKAAAKPAYPFSYEFNQPNFVINHVVIEHDDNGKGAITFTKRDFDEAYTDPIQLSPLTMQKLKTSWDALNFLYSTENYQAPKDFSHLGSIKLRIKRDERERTAELNWTDNKDAKSLMDIYRNLSQQYIWVFDITLARENQPLEAPKLMDSFEGMMRRNEITDPSQMVPFLNELGNDERIPLIARNHALKLAKQIEGKK